MPSEKQQEPILPISEKDIKYTKDGFERTEIPSEKHQNYYDDNYPTKAQIGYICACFVASFLTLAILFVGAFFNFGFDPAYALLTMLFVGFTMVVFKVWIPIYNAGHITKSDIRTLKVLIALDFVVLFCGWTHYVLFRMHVVPPGLETKWALKSK
jgi:hypothetical protein